MRSALLLAVLVPILATADGGLLIAVSSNFQAAANEIATEFTRTTRIPVRISSGSTGKLYAQIVNGAPFDIFLAADAQRPRILEESNIAIRGSRVTYAVGSLTLWSADRSLEGGDCLEALENGSYRRLAIANPVTAPYGRAAKEFLQATGNFENASERMVYGESISQVLHFVVTGNATLALIATSQAVGGLPVTASCAWKVPATTHSAIDQQGVVLTASTKPDAAHRFMDFLRDPEVVKILARRGYTVPD